MKSLLERFEDKFIPEPNSGCWLWTGGLSGPGYGQIKINNRMVGAHRVSYELFNGPVTEKSYVLHKCDVRCCVNPDHLWLGGHGLNMADMCLKGRHANQKKTHCPQGHPLKGKNLYTYPDGRRECRMCKAAGARK